LRNRVLQLAISVNAVSRAVAAGHCQGAERSLETALLDGCQIHGAEAGSPVLETQGVQANFDEHNHLTCVVGSE
jgi:hypothetical protein